ncbi:unnamed protein product [Brassica oleracea]|uniref:(rape) hypothetical protein n=1 Tax=Brassica napus TaxID=3708 RepID=A0A816LV36_BRANA|nr:unnamed protein product [Brassica napus]
MGSRANRVGERWNQMGCEEKSSVIQEEIKRVSKLPSNSVYAVHRLKVLNKINELLSVQNITSKNHQDDGLEKEDMDKLYGRVAQQKKHIVVEGGSVLSPVWWHGYRRSNTKRHVVSPALFTSRNHLLLFKLQFQDGLLLQPPPTLCSITRRSFLHKILDYEDEFFAALMLILEGHSLRTTYVLFAESLYGLRRKSVRLRLRKGSSKEVQRFGLEKRQRVLSVFFLVVLQYFISKLHGIYNKEREAMLWESLWGSEDQGFDEANFFTGEETVVSRGDSGNHALSLRVQLATRIKKFVAVCYLWIDVSSEGSF